MTIYKQQYWPLNIVLIEPTTDTVDDLKKVLLIIPPVSDLTINQFSGKLFTTFSSFHPYTYGKTTIGATV